VYLPPEKRFPVKGGSMTNSQRIVWLILSACLALLLYLAFRGYLAPALLLDFANNLLC
jgi:hypothetical protein